MVALDVTVVVRSRHIGRVQVDQVKIRFPQRKDIPHLALHLQPLLKTAAL